MCARAAGTFKRDQREAATQRRKMRADLEQHAHQVSFLIHPDAKIQNDPRIADIKQGDQGGKAKQEEAKAEKAGGGKDKNDPRLIADTLAKPREQAKRVKSKDRKGAAAAILKKSIDDALFRKFLQAHAGRAMVTGARLAGFRRHFNEEQLRLRKVGTAVQFSSLMAETEVEVQARLDEEPGPDDAALAELLATRRMETADTEAKKSRLGSRTGRRARGQDEEGGVAAILARQELEKKKALKEKLRVIMHII